MAKQRQPAKAGRSRLNGLLSRRNTASHRCFSARAQGAPPPSGTGQRPERRIIFPRTASFREYREKEKAPPRELLTSHTPYVGIIRIRLRVEAKASSQPGACALRLPCCSHIITPKREFVKHTLTPPAKAGGIRQAHTTPWASMALATLRKPATFAPTMRSPGLPTSTEAS